MARKLVVRISALTELRKMKRRTKYPYEEFALECAISAVEEVQRQREEGDKQSRDIAVLDRMFRLEDPRP
jgi:hypothetical protein